MVDSHSLLRRLGVAFESLRFMVESDITPINPEVSCSRFRVSLAARSQRGIPSQH